MKKIVISALLLAFSTITVQALTVINQTAATVWVRWGYDPAHPNASYRAFQIPANSSFTETVAPEYGASTMLLNNTLPNGPVDYKWKYSVSADTLTVTTPGMRDMFGKLLYAINGVYGVKP